MRFEHTSRGVAALAMAVAIGLLSAVDAAAACLGDPRGQGPAGRVVIVPGKTALAAQPSVAARGSVVGLWMTDLLLGDGPDRYDRAFQQFHDGGTETMLSNSLPPSLGNVCLGIWRAVGPHTYEVKHVAWNWNPDGSLAGTFLLVIRLDVEDGGTSYAGSWSADSFDTSDQLIPELHAEGIARARRITFE